jgi:drug/metabolite transporter (DMT)-like permease
MATYAALAFLSLLWGSSFLLIKIAASAFDPFALALARSGVAAGTLLIAIALSGRGAGPACGQGSSPCHGSARSFLSCCSARRRN